MKLEEELITDERLKTLREAFLNTKNLLCSFMCQDHVVLGSTGAMAPNCVCSRISQFLAGFKRMWFLLLWRLGCLS